MVLAEVAALEELELRLQFRHLEMGEAVLRVALPDLLFITLTAVAVAVIQQQLPEMVEQELQERLAKAALRDPQILLLYPLMQTLAGAAGAAGT